MKSVLKIILFTFILMLLVTVTVCACAQPVITVTPGTTAPKAGSVMTLTYSVKNLTAPYYLSCLVWCDLGDSDNQQEIVNSEGFTDSTTTKIQFTVPVNASRLYYYILAADEAITTAADASADFPVSGYSQPKNPMSLSVTFDKNQVSAGSALTASWKIANGTAPFTVSSYWIYTDTADEKHIMDEIWYKETTSAAGSIPFTVPQNVKSLELYIHTKDSNQVFIAKNIRIPVVAAGPVSITSQPAGKSVFAGSTAKFSVAANGSGLKYQWQYRTSSTGSWVNSPASGNTTATLSVSATASRNGYQYRCIVTDAAGNKVTSAAATLTVATELKITKQTSGVTASAGTTAKFSVTATGTGLKYQWQYKTPAGSWNNTSAAGYNTATVSIAVTEAKNGYSYRCIVTDASGNKVTSSAATLTVPVLLKITRQTANVTASAGATANFSVTAVGTGLKYQWQYKTPNGSWNNTSASGYNTATVSIAVTAAKNGYSYRCIVSDASGNKVTSDAAALTVPAELKITKQTGNLTASAGSTAKFSVTAVGTGLKYQWQYKAPNGSWCNTSAAGYNTAAVSIAVTAAKNGYSYRCIVTDASGSKATSGAAMLTVASDLQITEQTVGVTASAGTTAKFSVTATGTGLKYQWQYKAPGGSWLNTSAAGYNTPTVSIAVTEAKNGYSYHCTVTDASGYKVTSDAATLTVPSELRITRQTSGATASAGATAKFSVTATGTGLKYQWQYKAPGGSWYNTSAPGCNTATVSIAVTAAKNGYNYRCIVTDASGNKVTSGAATLTVLQ